VFPRVVWCVLHAHVPLHASIGHVERAFGAQLAFGEVGLCLTLVEAACRHLTNVSPREVGLPPGLPRFVHRLGLDSDALAPPPALRAGDGADAIATAPAVSFGEVFGMSPPPPFQVPWPSDRALQRQPPIGLGGIDASDFAADDDDAFEDGVDEDDEDDEAGSDDDRIAGGQDEFPASVVEDDSSSVSAEHYSKSTSAVFESGSVAADDAHLALLRRRFSGTASGPSSRRASLSSSDAQPAAAPAAPAAPAASELIDTLKKLSIRVAASDEIVEQAGLVMTEPTCPNADTNADEPDLR
jgi:hypothetical protein